MKQIFDSIVTASLKEATEEIFKRNNLCWIFNSPCNISAIVTVPCMPAAQIRSVDAMNMFLLLRKRSALTIFVHFNLQWHKIRKIPTRAQLNWSTMMQNLKLHKTYIQYSVLTTYDQNQRLRAIAEHSMNDFKSFKLELKLVTMQHYIDFQGKKRVGALMWRKWKNINKLRLMQMKPCVNGGANAWRILHTQRISSLLCNIIKKCWKCVCAISESKSTSNRNKKYKRLKNS